MVDIDSWFLLGGNEEKCYTKKDRRGVDLAGDFSRSGRNEWSKSTVSGEIDIDREYKERNCGVKSVWYGVDGESLDGSSNGYCGGCELFGILRGLDE